MIAYKVVREARGKLYSSAARGAARLEYPPGTSVQAPSGTALFAFRDTICAKNMAEYLWKQYGHTYEVWLCRGKKSPMYLERIANPDAKFEEMLEVWQGNRAQKVLYDVPRGTVFMQNIKIEEKIARFSDYEERPMTAYKVVREHDGKYYSSSVRGSARVEYVPRSFVEAPKGTALFAFKDVDSARIFARDMWFNTGYHYEVWECKGKRSSLSLNCLAHSHAPFEKMLKMWAGYKPKRRYYSVPRGTVFMHSIKLEKKMSRFSDYKETRI